MVNGLGRWAPAAVILTSLVIQGSVQAAPKPKVAILAVPGKIANFKAPVYEHISSGLAKNLEIIEVDDYSAVANSFNIKRRAMFHRKKLLRVAGSMGAGHVVLVKPVARGIRGYRRFSVAVHMLDLTNGRRWRVGRFALDGKTLSAETGERIQAALAPHIIPNPPEPESKPICVETSPKETTDIPTEVTTTVTKTGVVPIAAEVVATEAKVTPAEVVVVPTETISITKSVEPAQAPEKDLPVQIDTLPPKSQRENFGGMNEAPETVYLITSRLRAISMPDFVWELFLERHSSHWKGQTNLSYGFEFIQRKPSREYFVKADFTDYSQPDAWFLWKDDPARGADFTSLSLSLLSVAVGVNWVWELSPNFSVFYGGGLGLAVSLGEVKRTAPSSECLLFLENEDFGANGVLNTANDGDVNDSSRLEEVPCVDEGGNPSLNLETTEKRSDIPSMVPLWNISLGTQLIFADDFVWRFETGTDLIYFYAGTSIGYQL